MIGKCCAFSKNTNASFQSLSSRTGPSYADPMSFVIGDSGEIGVIRKDATSQDGFIDVLGKLAWVR